MTTRIRIETYTVGGYWPDTLRYEDRPSGRWQCRMYSGPAADNRVVSCGPYRPTEFAARFDAATLRPGKFS